MDWSQRSIQLWDDASPTWDTKNELWTKGPRSEMLQFFFQLNQDKDLKVLDLGCGPGESTRLMKLKGYQAVGVDQSEDMVNAAKKRGIDAVQSQCDPLPFEDEQFDSVFACTSLEWTEQPYKIIKEAQRVLKPKGKLIAVTLGPYARPRKTAYNRLYGEPVIHNMMMPWELLHLLQEHGFSCIDMQGAFGKDIDSQVIEFLEDNWLAKASLSFLWAFAVEKE